MSTKHTCVLLHYPHKENEIIKQNRKGKGGKERALSSRKLREHLISKISKISEHFNVLLHAFRVKHIHIIQILSQG